ncbi:hypothetical protein Q7C36_018101 [Tachysurus vachellii]|uniref:Liver-expressed antimicrobial peptide 2 n=1 Tax=Tachysurus vachellii TaxID=175792 RepID=A0AA88LZ35_TACVA|nr:liver-expressed antimicrobial peptide 2-like [Tachysurus vachellii]KAK2827175.1 hypothetical protein Q7C36_018101 [Tachysurus vachellii]
MQHYNQTITIFCLLALIFTLHQATSAPTLISKATSAIEHSDKVLNRKARMTPLWRILASKPHGAYCYDHLECSTGLCRNGFCSFDEPVQS